MQHICATHIYKYLIIVFLLYPFIFKLFSIVKEFFKFVVLTFQIREKVREQSGKQISHLEDIPSTLQSWQQHS